MGMFRTPHQRHLGTRRLACIGAEPRSAREVTAELVWAREDSVGHVQTLLLLAEAEHLAKLYATEEWASHAMYLYGLMAMADELDCDPVAAPRPDRPATAAATLLAQSRSRGDCLDRPTWRRSSDEDSCR